MTRLDIGVLPQNLYHFSEGSVVRSVYTNLVYRVSKHRNGMTDLTTLSGTTEQWNSCNNQHFIFADYISPAIRVTIL